MIMTTALSLLGGARAAVSALFSIVARHPWQCALVAALALAWIQYSGKQRALDQRDKARQAMAEMVMAQDAAKEAQDRVNREWQAKSERLAKEADNAKDTLDRYRTAADRFASGNSLRKVCGGATGVARPAPEDGAPENRDEPGADAGMVVVARNDFDIFVENSLRLKLVQEWGDSLIREGMAVPAYGEVR